MIINLNKSVPLKELCKISAIGYTTDEAKCIEFTFSHEAIIGFATELLWMYEDINDSKKMTISTYPLQVDPSPCQAIGFYLTPNSPLLVLKVNSLVDGTESRCEYKNWKEIGIPPKKGNLYYNVKEPSDVDCELICVEPYELSKKNIVNISVFNENGEDISQYYSTVTFEINRKGIIDLATMLLIWANNCKNAEEYPLAHIDKANYGYNFGVILTCDSIATKFKCCDLGTASDYDSRF